LINFFRKTGKRIPEYLEGNWTWNLLELTNIRRLYCHRVVKYKQEQACWARCSRTL